MSQPKEEVRTTIKQESDLPPMPPVARREIPTMEECEGRSVAIGQPFLLTRETEEESTDQVESAIEGDGLDLRVGRRKFRLHEITDAMLTHTAERIKVLLGEACVTGVSVQNGLVLHAAGGDLHIPKDHFDRIAWGLHDAEHSGEPVKFEDVSFTLVIRDPLIQKVWTTSSRGVCAVSFGELPAAPSQAELAGIDR